VYVVEFRISAWVGCVVQADYRDSASRPAHCYAAHDRHVGLWLTSRDLSRACFTLLTIPRF
jgi:hypothetical protein